MTSKKTGHKSKNIQPKEIVEQVNESNEDLEEYNNTCQENSNVIESLIESDSSMQKSVVQFDHEEALKFGEQKVSSLKPRELLMYLIAHAKSQDNVALEVGGEKLLKQIAREPLGRKKNSRQLKGNRYGNVSRGRSRGKIHYDTSTRGRGKIHYDSRGRGKGKPRNKLYSTDKDKYQRQNYNQSRDYRLGQGQEQEQD